MNDDEIPLRIVDDNIFDTKNVANNPKIIANVSAVADNI